MKKLLFIVTTITLTIIWMGVIFFFSSQAGDESTAVSGNVTKLVINIFFPNFDLLLESEKNNILQIVPYIVRKVAHFSEFGILELLLFFSVKGFTKNEVILYTLPLGLSFIYACSDEFHQMFIDNRGPAFKDVVIDTLGAITMLLIVGIIYNIVRIRKARKKYD